MIVLWGGGVGLHLVVIGVLLGVVLTDVIVIDVVVAN